MKSKFFLIEPFFRQTSVYVQRLENSPIESENTLILKLGHIGYYKNREYAC